MSITNSRLETIETRLDQNPVDGWIAPYLFASFTLTLCAQIYSILIQQNSPKSFYHLHVILLLCTAEIPILWLYQMITQRNLETCVCVSWNVVNWMRRREGYLQSLKFEAVWNSSWQWGKSKSWMADQWCVFNHIWVSMASPTVVAQPTRPSYISRIITFLSVSK